MNPFDQPIVLISIIVFFIWMISNNSKKIEEGKGDEVDTYDYWGNPSTHKENFHGYKITLGVFLLVLFYIFLTQ